MPEKSARAFKMSPQAASADQNFSGFFAKTMLQIKVNNQLEMFVCIIDTLLYPV